MQPIKDKDKSIYRIPSYDFGKGACSCTLVFSHSEDTTIARVRVGGKEVGIAGLSSMGKTDTVRIAIDPLSGVNDVEIETEGAVISDVSFDAEEPYPVTYQPIPEDTLTDNGHEYWESVDMLGRRVISAEDVRSRQNKKVGIFYWTWRESHACLRTLSVTEVLNKYPAAEYSKNHPAWGAGPFQPHWHEPLYGFYRNTDPYVIRHHAVMLADAGVDFVVFDCTNSALLWRTAYEAVLKGFREARADGIRTPQIAFMLNFGPFETTRKMLVALYQNLYKPGLYSDLWYRIEGKPFIMAYDRALPENGESESETKLYDEIRSFFSFRPGQPLYEGGTFQKNQWGWLENYPQNKYCEREDGSCEEVTVGVAQNSSKHRLCTYFNDKDTFGRSYTDRDGHTKLTKESYKYGYNFSEQWERALQLDPDTVFVTGFNEWIMGQFKEPWITDPDSTQLAMVDQFDREHSRDIEPDKDGYLDSYYLLLASYIRRFKGAAKRPAPSNEKTITSLDDFGDVRPIYRSSKGTTIHRDWDGFKGWHYVNETGRNDLVLARVARDAESLWFLVQTSDPITAPSERNWMTLYLDTKRSGWFDYALNLTAPEGGKTAVYHSNNGKDFGKIGYADIKWEGNRLMLGVSRALLGLCGKLDFEFKWSDNRQSTDAMDFYVNGDTAPSGRFNFRFKE